MRSLAFKSVFGAAFVELDNGKGTAELPLPCGLAVLEEAPLTYGALPDEDVDSDDPEPGFPVPDRFEPEDSEPVDGEAESEVPGAAAPAPDGLNPVSLAPTAEVEAFAFAHLVRRGLFELLATVAAPTGAFESDKGAGCATGELFSGLPLGKPLSLAPADAAAPATWVTVTVVCEVTVTVCAGPQTPAEPAGTEPWPLAAP